MPRARFPAAVPSAAAAESVALASVLPAAEGVAAAAVPPAAESIAAAAAAPAAESVAAAAIVKGAEHVGAAASLVYVMMALAVIVAAILMPGTVMSARIAVLFRSVRPVTVPVFVIRPVIVPMLVIRGLAVMILLGLLRKVLMSRNVRTARASMISLAVVVHRRLSDGQIMQDLPRYMADVKAVGFCVRDHRGEAAGIIACAVERHRLRRGIDGAA